MSDSLDDFISVSQAIRLSRSERREAQLGIQAFMQAHPLVAGMSAPAFDEIFAAASDTRLKMKEKDAGRDMLVAFMRKHPQRGTSPQLLLNLWKGMNIFGSIRPFFLSCA